MGAAIYVIAPAQPSSILSSDLPALRSFGGLVAQLAGTFAGFVITFLALIFALPDRPILRDMRDSGHFLELCANLFSCVLGFVAAMVTGAFLSIAVDAGAIFRILVCMAPGVGFMVFQAAIRLVLLIFVVARPT